ncbi:putative uncharacterized protein DDB_G0294196, partial [Aphidius gifuensis]|uniref:putative uncharacterized protein DDB_G0294196 n=1 Tax=Aphidius gifuensis TaxID=684658 RepID=UPI001CDC190D
HQSHCKHQHYNQKNKHAHPELIIQQEPAQQLQHTKPEPQQKIPQQPLVLGIQQELQKQQEQLTPTPTHQEEIPQYPPALEIQEVIPQEQEQPIPAPQQEIPQYPLTLGIQEELPQEQEQPIPAPQQEIPQNLLALEIQEQLPQQHEQPIPEPQREIPQHPLALGIQEELPQQHEQPIPEPQREIKQHNEVEIVVENVHFPAEPQHESQLYGQNYDRDTMVHIGNQIYCRQTIIFEVQGNRRSATSIARRMIDGVFRPKKITRLNCTLTGQRIEIEFIWND